MKIAYIDCFSGISGDMTLGALIDAGIDQSHLRDTISSLGLPGCRLEIKEVKKRSLRAKQANVHYAPEQRHRNLDDIFKIIDAGRLTRDQRDLAKRIFRRLTEAEAKVHGTTLNEVHLHEVGAVDSIVDIVAVAVGFDLLEVDRVFASSVPTGTGTVEFAHGKCSIPAPATTELLCGIPIVESSIPHELTTPTGAAILSTLVDSFGPMPAIKIDQIGVGAGKLDIADQANVLRLIVGQTAETTCAEQVWTIETNLDDVSAELISYCKAKLWEANALEVYSTPIQMKKERPGTKLSVLCLEKDIQAIENTIFEQTTTLGLRRWPVARHVLVRQRCVVKTPFGDVEGKASWLPGGLPRFAPEYESSRLVADIRNIPLLDVYEAARKAFDPESVEKEGTH